MQRGMRTAALRTDAGSMRQILETLSTHPILSKEPAGRLIAVFPRGRRVSNLPHTSGFNGSTRCVLTCQPGKSLHFIRPSRPLPGCQSSLSPSTDCKNDLRRIVRLSRRTSICHGSNLDTLIDTATRPFSGAGLLAFRGDRSGHVSRFFQSSSSSVSVCCHGLPLRFAGRAFLCRGCG